MEARVPGTDGDIWAALDAVQEPELRRSIVELGMVKGLAVDGRTAVVALALPLPGEATRVELRHRIMGAAATVEGIDRVDVDVREMTDGELRE
ncbi:MAG TPA: iron-sulfur cluster assembly protein, partial [Acidimicrobiia bacterium]|nr:iron-sulfur cluster assembly protein [Acidimicrobiia bacterium]